MNNVSILIASSENRLELEFTFIQHILNKIFLHCRKYYTTSDWNISNWSIYN